MLGRRNLILLCLTICIVHVKCADKYTDENRPYEFGFTIDGEQHRHEKKDENGIIMGEFGFITADGVYHVTVYATDENGNFKILSMKNIRVKPYPTAKSGPERGRSLEYSSSPQVLSKSVPEQNKKQFKELPKPGAASPAKSCSHCKLPTTTTTTTQAPYIPSNELPHPAISQVPEIPPKYNKYEDKHSYEDVRAQGYLQHGQQQGQQQQQLQQVQQQVQQGQQQKLLQQRQQQLQEPQQQQGQQQVGQQPQVQQQQNQQPQGPQPVQQGTQGPQQQAQNKNLQQQGLAEQNLDQFNNEQNHSGYEIGPGQNNARNNERNYPQQSYTQEGLQNNDYQIQQQQQQQQRQQQQQQQQQYSNNFAPGQSSTLNQIGSPLNNPQSNQRANNNYPQSSYSQNGLGNIPNYQTSSSQDQTNPEGKDVTNNSESNIGQPQPQSVISENQGLKLQTETNRNPKSYDDTSNQRFNTLNPPPNAFTSHENSPTKKPQLVSAQMQIVDKNTDIHYKRPGEKDGLPDGLTKDDMSQLLYTFNYTVGFHGHFEEGYKNGAKVGYYYITGRNGVRTRVDYVADEKGFRPKITQEVLDLLSDDVPKPDTEKDPKYGLKGYEFKWLYYPVDTK